MNTFLDDQTLTLYIEESKEHLDTIESDLLELESQGDNFDEELVNKVFRAAHSIKGGGGFLGLTTIKELAHKIENILHLIRTNQLVPTPNLINLLLSAYDRLGELIDNPRDSNTMDISDHITKLDQAVSEDEEDEKPADNPYESVIHHPKANIAFTIRDADLKEASQGAKQLYFLDFNLIEDVHKQKKTPSDIATMLEDSGTIIDSKTSLDGCGDLFSDTTTPGISLCVLFSTIVEPELIGILFNLKESQIEEVALDQIAVDAPVEAPGEIEQDIPLEIPEPVATAQGDPVPVVAAQGNPTPAPPPPVNAEPNPPQDNPAKKEEAAPRQTSVTSDTLRVHVSILDQLMNKAGELVLARNQLSQAIQSWDQQSVLAAGQRVDLVTSELQETIMLTRMQPVGIVFNKFPRLVRGLAMDLGKKMELQLEGTEVELDKTIIEGLADPLTHLVRNSADHGIESPEIRAKKGKAAIGKILLKAFYESGQVLIEITDDGKGLDPEKIAAKAVSKGLYGEEDIRAMSDKEKLGLIMLPGFSTAEQITDVSGRGVGMDVVKTNLDKMGGQVELLSEIDRGTTIRIKLPLTLAIIPSLLVESTRERFALPQANVAELLRIPVAEIRNRIEKIGDADVLILRGELIPLLQLNNVLQMNPAYYDHKSGLFKPDRRSTVSDERLSNAPISEPEEATATGDTPTDSPSPQTAKDETTDTSSPEKMEAEANDATPSKTVDEEATTVKSAEKVPERRTRRDSDVIIVVLSDGSQKYGLIVDAVSDSVEIVVKPLGRHLAKNKAYAGATIMGDGHVALILDVTGMAELADLKSLTDVEQSDKRDAAEAEAVAGATRQTLLIFHNGPDEACAVPLAQVLRVEKIKAEDIELKGGKKIIQYRDSSLTVFALEEVANVETLEAREKLIVIIFKVDGNEIGLLAVQPLDVVDQDLILDDKTLRQPGIAGSTIVDGKTTLLVDIFEFIKIVNPHWFQETAVAIESVPVQQTQSAAEGGDQILLVEDSQFFRSQVKGFLEDAGYPVVEAEDGQQAWDYINQKPTGIFLVVTDLEMPNMDGFELTRHLKGDERFAKLPVIALTSLAAEEDVQRGKAAGIDDYQVKLDKEKLLESILNFIG